MVDLGGYVIILVETKDKKIKLYGKSAFRSVDVTASAKGPLYFLDSQIQCVSFIAILNTVALTGCPGGSRLSVR